MLNARHPRLAITRGLALVALAAATACGTEPAPAAPAFTDSVGVRIVEHPDGLDLASWTLSAEPEAVIGHLADEDPAHQFTQIRGAVRLSDGRIVVGDWGSREARYFDERGTHLLTVGGSGEGPGEIRTLYNVDRVRGDTMVIGGWPIGSRYWFDENGDFVRNQALGPWFPGMLGRTLVDGGLILDTYEFGSHGNTLENWAAFGTETELRPEGVVELVSADGDRHDTIGVLRAAEWHKSGVLRQSFAMHALPFSPIGLVAWSREHVFIGHTETAEVRAFDMDGTLSMIVRWTPDAVSVTADDRRTFRDDVLNGLRRPDQEPAMRRWLSEISYPDSKPTFSALISTEGGELWIRDSDSSGSDVARWTVYGPDGQAIATVDVPAELTVLDVDESHLVGKRIDQLGVETVWSYPVER